MFYVYPVLSEYDTLPLESLIRSEDTFEHVQTRTVEMLTNPSVAVLVTTYPKYQQ